MDTVESIKKSLQPIFAKESIVKAVLFGSCAKGLSNELSDVDIVIDSNGQLIGLDFFRVLDEIVQILQKDVDLFELLKSSKVRRWKKLFWMKGSRSMNEKSLKSMGLPCVD